MEWFYIDTAGSEFGPFDGDRMRAWFDSGLFHATGDDLKVRLKEWKHHRTISDIYGGDRSTYFTGKIALKNGGSGGRGRRRRERTPSVSSYTSYSPSRSRKRSRSRSRGRRRRKDRRGKRKPDRSEKPVPTPSQAPGQYPPASFFDASQAAPAIQHGYSAYGSAWGSAPPPPGQPMPFGQPWGAPPMLMNPCSHGMPPPGVGYPAPWGAPVPTGSSFGVMHPPPPFAPGALWGPPVPPPHGTLRLEDRSPPRRSPPRRNPSPRRGDRDRSRERAAARQAAVEDQAVLDRLGRDGIRELLSGALESLYKDRIKPLANYVRGRLKERSAEQVILKTFADLYAQHSDLFVLERPAPKKEGDSAAQTSGGNNEERTEEMAILFVKPPSFFKGWVDIDSQDDPYDEAVWGGLKKFLDTGQAFGGGRYGMSREIMQRQLPCLTELCLGEVCHLVQLAIQKRKILVYHKKMLKSTKMANEIPNGDDRGDDSEEVTDMNQLCKVLFKMHAKYPTGLRLDRLKRVMKEEFGCRLNEMAFQCTKLIELFKKEPLNSTFVVCPDKKAFVVKLGEPSMFTEKIKELYNATKA